MGFFDLANHLFNFVMPAIAMGVMMPLASRLVWRKVAVSKPLKTQMLITTAAGTAVLIAGLVIFGNDGKMMTYLALVLVAAGCQWWFQGAWRVK